MNSFVSTQAIIFLLSILNGIFLGFLYDLLRVFRRMIKHPRWLVGLQDLVYWVVCSLIIFMEVFRNNDGNLRGFLCLGVCLGLILYFMTLSKLILAVFMKVYGIILKIVKTLLRIVWLPIKILLKPIYFIIRKIYKYLKKLGKWLIIKYKKGKRSLRIMLKKK